MFCRCAPAVELGSKSLRRWPQARLSSLPRSAPKAYLSAIVTRLCIDQLRSARARRESYVGDWLPEPLLTGLRTLIVDDDQTTRKMVREMLFARGALVGEASSAQAALDGLAAAERDSLPYRLVLLDCSIPDTDGFALAGQLEREFALVAKEVAVYLAEVTA